MAAPPPPPRPRSRSGRRASSIHEASLFTADAGADHIVATLLREGKSAVLEDIAEAEHFLRCLPDANYECLKVNRRGRKQRRMLGLRTTRILNCRPGGEVTKSFHYNEVTSATLDDPVTLRITYSTDHAFVYIMKSATTAAHVAMEVNHRCAVLRALRKKRVTFDVARKFQQQLLQANGLAAGATSVRHGAKKERHRGATMDALTSDRLLTMDSLYGGQVRFVGGQGSLGNAPSTLYSVQRGVVLGTPLGRADSTQPTSRAGVGLRVLSDDVRMHADSGLVEEGVCGEGGALQGAIAEGESSSAAPAADSSAANGTAAGAPRRRRRAMSVDMGNARMRRGGGLFGRLAAWWRGGGRAEGRSGEGTGAPPSDPPTPPTLASLITTQRTRTIREEEGGSVADATVGASSPSSSSSEGGSPSPEGALGSTGSLAPAPIPTPVSLDTPRVRARTLVGGSPASPGSSNTPSPEQEGGDDVAFLEGLVRQGESGAPTPRAEGGPTTAAWSRARTRVLAVVRMQRGSLSPSSPEVGPPRRSGSFASPPPQAGPPPLTLAAAEEEEGGGAPPHSRTQRSATMFCSPPAKGKGGPRVMLKDAPAWAHRTLSRTTWRELLASPSPGTPQIARRASLALGGSAPPPDTPPAAADDFAQQLDAVLESWPEQGGGEAEEEGGGAASDEPGTPPPPSAPVEGGGGEGTPQLPSPPQSQQQQPQQPASEPAEAEAEGLGDAVGLAEGGVGPPPAPPAAPRADLGEDSALEAVRRFMDGLHDHVLRVREAELSQLQVALPYYADNEGVGDSGAPDDAAPDGPAVLDTVSSIVMREVEVAVYMPLAPALTACLDCAVNSAAEARLTAQLSALRRAPQAAFGIPTHLRAPDSWAPAVLELQEVGCCDLPSDKLRALLAAARAIYAAYAATQQQKAIAEHLRDHPHQAAILRHTLGLDVGRGRGGAAPAQLLEELELPPPAPLGADDFFPIYTFVVVRAQLSRPLLLKELLWSLCDPLMLQGEGGYYLTMFEAALEYAGSMDPTEALTTPA